jgi:hypothetical protein
MRKFLLVSIVAVLPALGCGGCNTCPEMKGFADAWKVIGPEYEGYVLADPKLASNDPTSPEAQKRANRLAVKKAIDAAIATYEGRQ